MLPPVVAQLYELAGVSWKMVLTLLFRRVRSGFGSGEASLSNVGGVPLLVTQGKCGPGLAFTYQFRADGARSSRGRCSGSCAATPTASWRRRSSSRGSTSPQANTLIVERADQLGLAQAYQIRGRVGRSKERAFAYMLYPSEEAAAEDAGPGWRRSPTTPELGSGFAIAMRDLELRGAGDLLGDEQSGHVAAIGFELYVAMLDEAVEELRAAGEAEGAVEAGRLDIDVDAYLPADYIPFEAAKIDVHRRIAGARAGGELRALRDELRDRFGPVPEPVANLLALQRARIDLGAAGPHGGDPWRAASVIPLELDAATVGRLRERIPEAMFELRTRTLSLRVGDDPGERLEARSSSPTRSAPRWPPSRCRLSASILSLPLARCRYAAEPVSPQGKRSRPQRPRPAAQPTSGRSSAAKRIGIVGFAVLLVALFVIVAVARDRRSERAVRRDRGGR